MNPFLPTPVAPGTPTTPPGPQKPVTPAAPPNPAAPAGDSGSYELILWNQHSGETKGRGTKACKVEVFGGTALLWKMDRVEVPWEADADTYATVQVPKPAGRVDRVRVTITEVHGLGGGLAEIEWLDKGVNIAPQGLVKASGRLMDQDRYDAKKLIDGITTSEKGQGVWLPPDKRPGVEDWAELSLPANPVFKPKKSIFPAIDLSKPADNGTPAPVRPTAAAEATLGIPNALTPEEVAQGWKLLFDGTKLIGLRGVQKSDPLSAGWKIKNGELNLPKESRQMDERTGGDLMTVEQFWDFEFRFEWRCTVAAQSGIRYLVSSAMGQSPTGLEYQIIDDVHNAMGLKGGLLRRSGALDNILPVGENARLRTADPMAKKGDPWNEGKIVVQGNHVEHWMNGEKVLEFTLSPTLRTTAERNYNKDETFAQRPHATFGTKVKSPIVIMDQGLEVAFRNLKVRSLVTQPVVAPVSPTGKPATPSQPLPSNIPNPFLIPPKK